MRLDSNRRTGISFNRPALSVRMLDASEDGIRTARP